MFHALALAAAIFSAPASPAQASTSCAQLSLQCDRCNPRVDKQLDALQACSRALFSEDESQCAARLKPTRSVCR